MSAPRSASCSATTWPMRLPPVIRATVLVSCTGRAGLAWRAGLAGRSGPTGLPCLPAVSVRERPEERRSLVRVAPLRPERGAGEHVLRGDTDGRLGDLRERVEPLHRAAGRVVREVLVDVERHLAGRHFDLAAVV